MGHHKVVLMVVKNVPFVRLLVKRPVVPMSLVIVNDVAIPSMRWRGFPFTFPGTLGVRLLGFLAEHQIQHTAIFFVAQ